MVEPESKDVSARVAYGDTTDPYMIGTNIDCAKNDDASVRRTQSEGDTQKMSYVLHGSVLKSGGAAEYFK